MVPKERILQAKDRNQFMMTLIKSLDTAMPEGLPLDFSNNKKKLHLFPPISTT